ncbi:MAG: GTPase HflX [Chloroflexi bacterium]|nr:MAG: GTPase HflX [Chloroflexota bacterium]TME47026.1 MAG: GTPase HflX [Chloroflexota bacterium]
MSLDYEDQGLAAVEEQMLELSELARTAGVVVVGTDRQRRHKPDPALFIGKGKAEALHALKHEANFDLLIFNEELSPRQQRNLERKLDLKVIDRSELILDIFAQRARTKEGRLQVEAAQLHHLLPRLQGGRDLSRLGGGIGTRGPGEQKLETDRQRIRHRIRDLDQDIKEIRKQRALRREGRRRVDLPVVAIVGYTNSGKSTLLHALTQARVQMEDALFVTLDPTTRLVRLPNRREVLFTDTVGFIQKLPTDLVAAFKATLEEVQEADLLLHVLDATRYNGRDQMEAVHETLQDLGAMEKPKVLALNKVDELSPQAVELLLAEDWSPYRTVVPISALKKSGLEALGNAIAQTLPGELVSIEVLLPYTENARQAEFHAQGNVEAVDYRADGVAMRGTLPRRLLPKFDRFKLSS